MTVTVAIIQPAYLPWLGYFDQMAQADTFVHYDDVQLSRKSWTLRNCMKNPAGAAEWLSVPVVHGQGFRTIGEAVIAAKYPGSSWRDDHVNKLRNWYRDAPHAALIDEFSAVIAHPFTTIADLDIAVAQWMAEQLGIYTPTMRSSEMGIPTDLDPTARPLAICQAVGAQRFICGPTAKHYIDLVPFQHAGIEIIWHDFVDRQPTYPQLHGPFLRQLSALDYLLNHGPGWFE